jgi:prepilin-type processing-associated H-X9-DG protein
MWETTRLFVRLQLDYLEQGGRASSRRQGKVDVVFCDGHVESPTLKFVFEDTSDAALVRWKSAEVLMVFAVCQRSFERGHSDSSNAST